MFKALTIIGSALLVSACQPEPLGTCQSAIAVDGDTIKCTDGTHLRLNGIDAPELPGHHHHSSVITLGDGLSSALWLHQLVDGRDLTYTPLKLDRYGRTVAEVELVRLYPPAHTDLSCVALSAGTARYIPQWDEQSIVERTCR